MKICRDCLLLTVGANNVCDGCGSARLLWHQELPDLRIAHIDCDSFYASVEKRDDPSLADRPLIVGHEGGRGVVTTACYIARRYGVRSAMPMFKARDLCPQAVILRPNTEKYRAVSRQIREIFLSVTSVIEPLSLDEAYLDLAPEHHLCDRPPAVSLADIARRVEAEVGITVSVGLAGNKFLAKLASDLNKPRGFSVIGRAEARSFLAGLSVRKIFGVGEVSAAKMEKAGINTIGQLQTLSDMELVARFGSFGRRLAMYAQGEDDRKVTPERQRKSVSAETTFAQNLNLLGDLDAALRPLCQRVAEDLRKADLAGYSIVLKLKRADFTLLTRSHALQAPTQSADTIHRHALQLLRREVGRHAFRLIGIGMSDLCDGGRADPPDLFDLAGL